MTEEIKYWYCVSCESVHNFDVYGEYKKFKEDFTVVSFIPLYIKCPVCKKLTASIELAKKSCNNCYNIRLDDELKNLMCGHCSEGSGWVGMLTTMERESVGRGSNETP